MFQVKEVRLFFNPYDDDEKWDCGKPSSFYESDSYLESILKAGQIIGGKYAAIIYLNGKEIQAVWENEATGEISAAPDLESLIDLLNQKERKK